MVKYTNLNNELMSGLPDSGTLTPIVPHYLLPGRPIDQALLDHIDEMIHYQQGFVVLDFTGALTGQICRRLPGKRAKDCCLVDLFRPDRVFSVNLLQRCETLDPLDQAADAVAVLQSVLERSLTTAEIALLRQSCHALLLATDISPHTGYFDQTYNLLKLWGLADFRQYTDQFLWDLDLKRYWQEFDPKAHQSTIRGLCQKLDWLFADAERLTALQGGSQVDFSGVMEGKMFFIKALAPFNQSRHTSLARWRRYVATVFEARFLRSLQNQTLAQALLFTNASISLGRSIQPMPGTSFNPKLENIITKYSAMKYARKDIFVESELGAFWPPESVERLQYKLGVHLSLPARAYKESLKLKCQ